MIKRLRVTVLADNCVAARDLLAEHGLSMLIEADDRRILFDTGQGKVLRANADALGISLSPLDAVVLSHGHDDHNGGLAGLLREVSPAAIFLHPAAMQPKYAKSENPPHRSIGMPESSRQALDAVQDRIVWTRSATEVVPGVWCTGEIPRLPVNEQTPTGFFLDADCREPDPIADDQALFIDTTSGLVVIAGILGGMSPESTTLYYEHITRTYTAQHGDYGYPEVLIYSVNFQKFVDWQRNGQWHEAAKEMAGDLERLRLAGADFGLIATNTMHFVFDEVQQAVQMPLLSIVDATVEAILGAGLRSVGLLGSLFTMRERFFLDVLERAGIAALVPEPGEQLRIHEVIFQELCRGEIRPESRTLFLEVIERLRARGAQGIILGCTEIPLLVQPQHCDLPLFNTALLHAAKALTVAVQPEK
jgi:aspartate racemase